MFELLNHLPPAAHADALGDAWVRARRPERECDRALTGTARQWLRRLPSRRRPLRLCLAHPRVVEAQYAVTPGRQQSARRSVTITA